MKTKISKKKLAKFIFNTTILIISIAMLLYYFYILAIYPFISKETTGLTFLGILELILLIFVASTSYTKIRDMYIKK